jgi:hypothetical protein
MENCDRDANVENAPRFGDRDRPEVRFHGGAASSSCDFSGKEGELLLLHKFHETGRSRNFTS